MEVVEGNKGKSKLGRVLLIVVFGILMLFIMSIFAWLQDTRNPQTTVASEPNVMSNNYDSFKAAFDAKTELQQQDYVKQVVGQRVQWDLRVEDVRDGYMRLEEDKAFGMSAADIRFSKDQQGEYAKYNKGEKLRVIGTIKGNEFGVWVLGDVRIVER